MTLRRQRLALWMDDECRRLRTTSRRLERRYKRSRLADDRRLWVEHERKERAYWMAQVCSEAKHPQQLWRSLNTLMGASENNLPRNCPSAQQFANFFEAKVAAVRKATGNSGVSTKLQPATEVFDHFETCTSTCDHQSTVEVM